MIISPRLRRCSNDGRFNFFKRSLYGKFLSIGINLVTRFWTRSTALISQMKCGPHIMLVYSRWGCTIDVNRRGRVSSSNATNNLLINPRMELAFFTAADVCVWNFSWLSIMVPKSFSPFTFSYVDQFGMNHVSTDMHTFTLSYIEW